MAITFRCYVFEEAGALKHIPRRVAEGLHIGEDALPEYANSKQRVAEVVLENEGGKPVRILDARGYYWAFDAEGKLERDYSRLWLGLRDREPTAKGNVVDIRPEIERNKWKAENLWDLTKDDLDRLAAALWPWAVEGETPEVKAVKGKIPKKPPLTLDAREALTAVMMKTSSITHQLEKLSEPALKGFAYEARRHASTYLGEKLIWSAIAEEADRQREIKARHRTGKGVWYATLSVWYWNEDRSESREVDTVEERCESKKEAVEAGRRLLAENANRFDERVSLDVEIISELEWTPIARANAGNPGN